MPITRKALAPNEKQLVAIECGELLRFRSRDDKTPLELFLAGIRDWEAGLQRRLDDAKPFPEKRAFTHQALPRTIVRLPSRPITHPGR